MSLKRFALVYVVMLVAVVLVTHFVSPRLQASLGVAEGSMLGQFVPMLLLFAGFVSLLTLARRQGAALVEAERLLEQGRTAQALSLLEAFRAKHPSNGHAAAKLGIARARLWKLSAALPELEAALRLGCGPVAPLVVEHQALVKALLGDVAGARQALGQRPSSADPRLNTLTEAVLQLRAGDLEGARTRLGRFDAKQLAGTFGALGRALEGFCVAQLSGELRHVDRVALYGETGSGELASAWPELVAFVERAPPA